MRHSKSPVAALVRVSAIVALLAAVPGAAYANAIIPYMAVPWGQVILLPLVVLAEAPFIRRHAGGSFGLAAWHSLLGNLASTVAGAAIYLATMALVGDSLFRFWSKGHLTIGGQLRSMAIATAFAVVLWLISYVVEFLTVLRLRKPMNSRPIRLACIQANALTYAVLLLLAFALGG
jgi:hypothetical protein